jgi:hypothetical protein
MQNNESVCAPAHNRARGTHMQRCFNVLRLHRGGLAAREQLVIAPRHGTGVQIRVRDAQQQLCAMLRVLLVAGVLQQRAKLLCTRVIPNSTRDGARPGHRAAALGCTPGTLLAAPSGARLRARRR